MPDPNPGSHPPDGATPLVSVCMITYNHAPYLAQAIDCVLAQKTSFPFELVIGEDRSKDGTRAIAEEYQRRYPDRIRIVASDDNVGMQRNLLRTEAACRGTFIAYCEGDDYWHNPDKLQLQVDHLQRNSEVNLVHGDYNLRLERTGTVVESLNKVRGRTDYSDITDVFTDVLRNRYEIATCTTCVRATALRQALDHVKPLLHDPESRMGDLPRWLYIARHGRVAYLPICMSTYRVLEESASHSEDNRNRIAFQKSSRTIRHAIAKQLGADVGLVDSLERDLQAVLLRSAFETGDGKAADLAIDRLHRLGGVEFKQRVMHWGARSQTLKTIIMAALVLRRRHQERRWHGHPTRSR